MKARRSFVLFLLIAALFLAAFAPLAAQRFDWVITKKLSVLEGGAFISSNMDMDSNIIQNIGASGTDFDTSGGLTLAGDLSVAGNISGGSGAFTVTDQLMIDGAADAVQLTVQGYTTQTNNIFVVENSSGTDKLTVDNSGNLVVAGTSNLQGNLSDSGGALTAADNVLIDGAADAIQLTVQGYTTQTNVLQTWEQSDGTDVATLSNAGVLSIEGALTLQNDETIANSTDGLITLGGGLQFSTTEITDTQTITPLASTFYTINSSGAASITMTACSAAGQIVFMYGDDANNITVPDSNIRTSDGNAVVFDQYDLVTWMCSGSEWILLYESNTQ